MRNVWYTKAFVLVIIVLFLGVGFQPALANEISTNIVSDVDEDCNCKPINDIQVVRIERLLDRLENRINFILLRYGHLPEVAEKCEEVLGVINSDGLLDIICDFIDILVEYFLAMYEILPYELWLLFFMIPSAFVLVFGVMFCLEYP